MPLPLAPLVAGGIKFAAAKGATSGILGFLTSKAGIGLIGAGLTTAGTIAQSQATKAVATAAATRAAATAGLGAVAAGAIPWVVGGLTIYQLGKLGCKLLESDDKK